MAIPKNSNILINNEFPLVILEQILLFILLGINKKTLYNRIRSWGASGSDFNFEVWAKDLRAKKLIDYYKQGMHTDEIAKQFVKFDLPGKGDIADNVERIRQIDVDSLTTIPYSERSIHQWTKDYLGITAGTAYELFYVKPIILILAKLGLSKAQALEVLEAMGVVSRKGVPYDKDSLTRMLKDRLWGLGQGLPWGGGSKPGNQFRDAMMEPIIESLIRYKDSTGKYLSAETIGQFFGRTGNFIKTFIKRRWGFNTITEARAFFETHYLGFHDYDYFSFS